MIRILLLFFISLTWAKAQQYDIYDMNGKNIGTIKEEINKYTLKKIVKNYHGSILVKKGAIEGINSFTHFSTTQAALANHIEKNISISQDSLDNDFWIEMQKNEIANICLDRKVLAWETSLSSSILNDSCLIVQAPILTGTEPINVFFSEDDHAYRINLAIDMKYLNFKNEEVLLGYNKITGIYQKIEDPERLEVITGSYLVDKYPVTNCEITQLMWDSIPTNPSFGKGRLKKYAEEWALRKKNSERNKNCISKDTAASIIFLLQAMKYANARSIREGQKPYYKFSKTSISESKIISKGHFATGFYSFHDHEDIYIDVTIDSTSYGYRLPYYDEWMMLARGGDKKNKAPWGDSSATFEEATKYARFDSWVQFGKSEPVGQLKPNGYGLYDIFGLVWEHVLFEKKNHFSYLKNRPSCLKGGDNHIKKNPDDYPYDEATDWKNVNYGLYEPNYNGGYPGGFRLIRNIGNNAKWSEVKSDNE